MAITLEDIGQRWVHRHEKKLRLEKKFLDDFVYTEILSEAAEYDCDDRIDRDKAELCELC